MNICRSKRFLSLPLMVLLLGFPQISETIYTPSLPDLAKVFRVGADWAEFTLSIYFMGFAAGVFLWGLIADQFGRRSAMLWGLIIYGLGSWGCYQSQHIYALLAWRVVQALGASAGSVVTQTMIRDLHSGVRRNQIFSIVGGVLALSPAIGPFIGGWIDELLGWRGNFAFLVAMGGTLFIYSFLKLPETHSGEENQSVSFCQVAFQLIHDKKVWGYALLVAGCNGIIFSYYAEAPFLFINLLHYTPSQYGTFGIMLTLASLLASVISHRLNSAEMPAEKIVLFGCYLMGLAVFGLLILVFWRNI